MKALSAEWWDGILITTWWQSLYTGKLTVLPLTGRDSRSMIPELSKSKNYRKVFPFSDYLFLFLLKHLFIN